MRYIHFNLLKNKELKKNIIFSVIIIFGACSSKLDDSQSIMSTMKQWKQAVLSENPREIAKFYSNNFFSEEIGGKEQVAEFWKIVINAGMIDGIEINLNTSQVDFNGDVAEFLIFNDGGEIHPKPPPAKIASSVASHNSCKSILLNVLHNSALTLYFLNFVSI